MPAPEVTREDLKRVEDRVEFVVQEVDGEKLVSRYILKQTRQMAMTWRRSDARRADRGEG